MQIPGFPHYDVREDGTVWSNLRRGGRHDRTYPWHQLKLKLSNQGYSIVTLCNGVIQKRVFVHHLVLNAFVGPRPAGTQTRHLDGNKLNNHASNLAWGTAADNKADALRHGTVPRGIRLHNAKLTDEAVKALRLEYSNGGIAQRPLAKKYGIDQSSLSKVIRRDTWAHVP